MSLLLNEQNKTFPFLKKGFFPRTLFMVPIEQYLKTLERTNCFVIASRTAYENKKEVLTALLSYNAEHDVFFPAEEPTEDDVATCVARLTERSKKRFFLLAFGGGSAMDLAKAVKYKTGVTLLAVPTTPATGSEVTPFAVTIDRDKKKKVYNSHAILPDAVVLDPTLISTIPDAALGPMLFDILGHGTEALFSKLANPLSSTFASDALCLVRKSVQERERANTFWENVQIAGILGGLAQSMASTGLCHAIAHVLGPLAGIPHSRLIARFLPDVFTFNLREASRLRDVLERYGESEEGVADLFERLRSQFPMSAERIDMPEGFNTEEAVAAISRDVCTLTNPFRPSAGQIETLLKIHVNDAHR